MSAHFSISELTHSSTADRLGLDNTPNDKQRANLEELANALEGLRTGWADYCKSNMLSGGVGIIVTSGLRTLKVNQAVGGASNSAHLYGCAADLKPANGLQSNFEFYVSKVYARSGAKYDQIIIEKSKSARWVHFGYKRPSKGQRMACFNLSV